MRVKKEPKSSDCLRACSGSGDNPPSSAEATTSQDTTGAQTGLVLRQEQEFLPMPPASSNSWRVFRPWQQEDHSNSQHPNLGPHPPYLTDDYDAMTNQNGGDQFETKVTKTSRRSSRGGYQEEGGNQEKPMDLTTLNRQLSMSMFKQEVEKSPRAKERHGGILSGTFQLLEGDSAKEYEGESGVFNQPTAFGLDPDTYEAFANSPLLHGNEHTWKTSSSLRVRTPVPYKPSFSFNLLSQNYLPSTSSGYHRPSHHLSTGYSTRPEVRGPTSVIHHHGDYAQGNLNFPPNATAESVPTTRSGQRESSLRQYDRCSCTPGRSGSQQYYGDRAASGASTSTSVNSIAARLHALRRRQCQSYREKYNYIFGMRDDLVPRRSASRSARKFGLFVDSAKPKTGDLDAQHCLWKAQQIARQICAQTGLKGGHN
ncbi:uncharacterized protein [Branchiostoma lanceolatum]|uniref:uncharacterized protein n=1 Tax=Branchiostoma lanceolatum TaxID=7740 RepID=UPI003451C089